MVLIRRPFTLWTLAEASGAAAACRVQNWHPSVTLGRMFVGSYLWRDDIIFIISSVITCTSHFQLEASRTHSRLNWDMESLQQGPLRISCFRRVQILCLVALVKVPAYVPKYPTGSCKSWRIVSKRAKICQRHYQMWLNCFKKLRGPKRVDSI